MAGLVPATHVLISWRTKRRECRHKTGHYEITLVVHHGSARCSRLPTIFVGEIDGAIVRPSNRYSGARVNEVGEISAALKGLAKYLDVRVLALAQLSRQVETRDERRPTMANLRD